MNIVVVGTGKGGTSIIKSFSHTEGINISQVISRRNDSEGALFARKQGIKVDKSVDDINPSGIDLIIEATGDIEIEKQLVAKYGNKCKVIDSKAAWLIMDIVDKDLQVVEKINLQMTAIKDASGTIINHINNISSNIDNSFVVTEDLNEFTRTSIKHIEESDRIIQYVNSIAKQIKILGINATIEAARAGEHGRGFSVVANEVQKLANSSETFAKEINIILGKLSDEIKGVTVHVEKLNALSKKQVSESANVNDAVQQLLTKVN